jgi:hypothetical protein
VKVHAQTANMTQLNDKEKSLPSLNEWQAQTTPFKGKSKS